PSPDAVRRRPGPVLLPAHRPRPPDVARGYALARAARAAPRRRAAAGPGGRGDGRPAAHQSAPAGRYPAPPPPLRPPLTGEAAGAQGTHPWAAPETHATRETADVRRRRRCPRALLRGLGRAARA